MEIHEEIDQNNLLLAYRKPPQIATLTFPRHGAQEKMGQGLG